MQVAPYSPQLFGGTQPPDEAAASTASYHSGAAARYSGSGAWSCRACLYHLALQVLHSSSTVHSRRIRHLLLVRTPDEQSHACHP